MKTQQSVVKPPTIDDSISVEEIKSSHLTNHKKTHKSSGMQRQDSPSSTGCHKSPPHTRDKCPARDAVCRRSSNKGHFQKVYRSKINPPQQPTINHIEQEDTFLRIINSD